ncbi:uncharacterized protein LOC114290320 [Camellia sinensis]|uniref:uncharacterized protein LOC114290320 n=1 Tax=Camellia sinensis TaxID=4442 RepID=UPI001036B23D|nr:uncharacterized protein LOC114290320 [Camellia sinensis]
MPVPPPIVQDHYANDRTIALTKEFKKMKPPLFRGGIDLLKVEAWVLGIEKLFEVFPCTEVQKVLLAAFTLEDGVYRWWMLIQGEHQEMNWAQFLKIFYEKYFPQSIRDKKVREFEKLKQGNKTVAEYEAQFTELACFASYIADMDYKKLQKYVNVLDQTIIVEGNQVNRNRYSDWKVKR